MSETYKALCDCKNCDSRVDVEIKRGTPIKDKECPVCGCKELWRLRVEGKESKK